MYQATPVSAGELLTNISTSSGYTIHEPMPMQSGDDHLSKIIDDYKAQLDARTQLHLGYPYNLDFDFSALHGLQNYSINNLGTYPPKHFQ